MLGDELAARQACGMIRRLTEGPPTDSPSTYPPHLHQCHATKGAAAQAGHVLEVLQLELLESRRVGG